jgi:chemotaxis protein methyltransferase CheR
VTEADLDFLRAFLHSRSGLSLTREKRYLLESRLGTLCRQNQIADIPAVVRQLRAGGNRALENDVVEVMTTNETLFFRDKMPFDLFRTVALPDMLTRNAATRTLRIWCAAVSTGQEAYSLAMILDEMAPRLAGWKIEIIGTDISEAVLEKARNGLYSQFEIQRGLPVQMLLKYFSQEGEQWRISEKIRAMVSLQSLNLLSDTARLGQFDVIFCRNVLIYFDIETKARVLAELARRLKPDATLFLGAAETVIGITEALAPDRVNRGIYRLPSVSMPVIPTRPALMAVRA